MIAFHLDESTKNAIVMREAELANARTQLMSFHEGAAVAQRELTD
jgi:hypothetical protein